jgi:transcription antitermination factor NusG
VPGVHSFLTIGGRYAIVPDEEMRKLLDISERAIECREEAKLFAEGEPVRIGDGPFYGLVGSVERVDSGERITVRLHIFGQETPVHLSTSEVDKL